MAAKASTRQIADAASEIIADCVYRSEGIGGFAPNIGMSQDFSI